MNTEKVMDRIRKLLAMGRDTSSPNEAAIAMKRARKLMDEYQISELDLTALDTSDFGVEEHDSGQRTLNRAMGILSVAVADYNDCNATVERNSNGNLSFRFKGLLADAVCARELYRYLLREMYSQAERAARGRADRHAYRMGFASGVAHQVRMLLRERQELKTSTGTSLVVVKKQLVENEFGKPRYSNARAKFNGGVNHYYNGHQAGQNANLSRQVGGSSQRRIGHG